MKDNKIIAFSTAAPAQFIALLGTPMSGMPMQFSTTN